MLYYIIFFIIGTIVGSFLNVCIYRLPRAESIISPASRCPRCKKKIRAFDLVPILSFFLLRGKCRDCGAKIPFRYPMVEFLSGALFLAVAYAFPTPLEIVSYLIFAGLLLAIFFIDLEHQVIPDSLNISGILFGLGFNFFRGMPQFFSALLGAGLGYLIFFLVSRIGLLIFQKEAMGEGDLFLAAFLGVYLGWERLFLAIFLAYLGAGVVALFLLAAGKVKMGQAVPFGPALAAAGLVTLFFGDMIANLYSRAFF